jgi:LysR family transcriptional regulator, regulator for metE and metH
MMPAMDAFRQRWPEIELDIVSGFHPDSIALVLQNRAEVAIVSEQDPAETVDYHALFRFEIMALMANDHTLAKYTHLAARHFADQTLTTYPVTADMLDIIRQVIRPAGVEPAQRRTTELTIAILQLVASGRGIATLPRWAVQGYLDRGYVTARPVGRKGLTGELHIACAPATSEKLWLADFVQIIRETCFKSMPGIELLCPHTS